jgi:hypothetical protein
VDAGHGERTAKVRSSDVSARIGGCVREGGRSRSLHSSILVFAGPGLFLDIVEQNLIEGAERGDVCARTLLADYERLHSTRYPLDTTTGVLRDNTREPFPGCNGESEQAPSGGQCSDRIQDNERAMPASRVRDTVPKLL